MKKFLALGAMGIAVSVAVFSGCGGKVRNLASLASNWYSYPDNKKIQPAFSEKAEKLSYVVNQTEKSSNGVYSAEYSEGLYTTEFTAEKIYADKLAEITLEEWRDYPLGGAEDEDGKFMVLYRYTAELTIPTVTYTFGSDKKTFENERRRTVSYFMSVKDYLSPVYTRTEIKSTSPASAKPVKPVKIEDCYIEVDRVYESFYNRFASAVTTKIYDNKEGKELTPYNLSKMDENVYSVFDSAYLDIVVRAMKGMSSGSSQTVSLYTPGAMLGNYVVSGSDTPLLDDSEACKTQLAGIQSILRNNGVLAQEDEETLSTTAMNVSYSNGLYSGMPQRYWFANANDKNGKRTIMVKYSCPLAYDSGCLEFVLSGIESLPEV